MKKICVQCKKEFELTDSEIVFYKEKGLSLPKRCKECRDANRKTKAGMNKDNIQKNYNKDITVDTYTVRKKKKGNRQFYLMVSLLVMIIVAGVVLFSSGNSLKDENSGNVGNYQQATYSFSNEESLNSHFQKHGYEFGYTTKEQYLQGAIEVIENPSSLKKTEAEDGDYVYYLQSTNEIVFVSPTGTIRTYFKPDDGIAYFNRQQVLILDFVA